MEFIEIINNRFAVAVLIVFISFFLSRLITIIIDKIVLAFTKKTKTTIDDEIVEKTKNPLTWLMVFFGLKFAVQYMQVDHYLINILIKLLISIQIFFAFYIGIIIADIIITNWAKHFARKTRSKIDGDVLPLARKTMKAILYIFAFLTVISQWGIDIKGFLAGMGIAGIAIGFAVKDSLANIFGGVSIILDKAFKVKDIIQLESGEMGEVTEIGLRSTRIQTWNNELFIIPNGYMANTKILNHNLPDLSARVDIKFGVEYGVKDEDVKKLILKTIKKNKFATPDPKPQVLFIEMADSSINFEARFWIKDVKNKLEAKVITTKDIYRTLNKAKIGIPFPTRTVYLKNEIKKEMKNNG